MVSRLICVAALVTIALGCGRSSRTDVVAPGPAPVHPDLTALVLPTIDSATLASLEALLGRLQNQSGLLSQLESPDPRIYSLFRDLEAAHATLEARLSSPDTDWRPLRDALARMTTQVDSVFRSL